MRSKGQISSLAFMLAIVIVILGLAFVKPVTEITASTMNSSYVDEFGAYHEGMNCTTTTDSFMKAGCWTTDISQAYFIGGIIAIAGIVISAKILFGGTD